MAVLGCKKAEESIAKALTLLFDDRSNGGDKLGTFDVRQVDDLIVGQTQRCEHIIVLCGCESRLCCDRLKYSLADGLSPLGRPGGIAGLMAKQDRGAETMSGEGGIAVIAMNPKIDGCGWASSGPLHDVRCILSVRW
jgi:hypothetical protein